MEENLSKESIFIKSEILCCKNNPAINVCVCEQCQEQAFMCGNGNCQCMKIKHFQCYSSNLQFILKSIEKQKIQILEQDKTAFKYIESTYDQIIQKFSEDRANFLDSIEYYGIRPNSLRMLFMVNDRNYQSITGKLMHKVREQIKANENNLFQMRLQVRQIQQYWEKKEKEIENIRKGLTNLIISTNSNSFTSKIISDPTKLKNLMQMLPKSIIGFQLLYRASENQYSSIKFHEKCNNIPHTLVIALSQYGNIIGGYTPLTWQSTNSWSYKTDPFNQTFLFSLTLNEKYKLVHSQRAIFNFANSGPDFGANDLYIHDKCNESSYTNFPSSFNNGAYQINDTARKAFAGLPAGNYFKIKEYQVYKVIMK